MLILTRKINEKIIINNGATLIEVMVTSVIGKQVRIGIIAPDDWIIKRADASVNPQFTQNLNAAHQETQNIEKNFNK